MEQFCPKFPPEKSAFFKKFPFESQLRRQPLMQDISMKKLKVRFKQIFTGGKQESTIGIERFSTKSCAEVYESSEMDHNFFDDDENQEELRNVLRGALLS